MNIHQNNTDNFINNIEYHFQYCSWIISEHDGNNIQTSPTHIINEKIYVVSNSQVFTVITMFTYIRPVNCNVQILNGSKSPAKGFGLVIIKKSKTNIIIPLYIA